MTVIRAAVIHVCRAESSMRTAEISMRTYVIPAKAGIQYFPAMEKSPCVYIITNKKNGTLYIGVTTQLRQRIWQHKEKVVEGFSKRYELNLLVYYEVHGNLESAILREKQLKKWNREWKLTLIREFNPQWLDLYLDLF